MLFTVLYVVIWTYKINGMFLEMVDALVGKDGTNKLRVVHRLIFSILYAKRWTTHREVINDYK